MKGVGQRDLPRWRDDALPGDLVHVDLPGVVVAFAERPDDAQLRRTWERSTGISPLFGGEGSGGLCRFWPVPGSDQARRVNAAGSGPILVVGGKGDPATPYQWAPRLTRELGTARLLTYEGEGHGAYTSGNVVLRLHLSFWVGLVLAALVAMVVAAAIGIPSFRTRGVYYIIVTVAFQMIMSEVFDNWYAMTQGGLGLRGIPRPGPLFQSRVSYYYIVLGVALVAHVLLARAAGEEAPALEPVLAGELSGDQLSEEAVMRLATGTALHAGPGRGGAAAPPR